MACGRRRLLGVPSDKEVWLVLCVGGVGGAGAGAQLSRVDQLLLWPLLP